MSVEREQFRLDMYERTPKEYIKADRNGIGDDIETIRGVFAWLKTGLFLRPR